MELQDEGLSEARRSEVRDRIIGANLRFVFKQAKKYSKNDPELFEELICAGNEGLLVGLEKYNPSRQVRFLSYAGWWVNQRILKEMSRMRIVALPIWKQQLAARIQRATENREGVITVEELKKEFPDIAEKDLRELHKTRYLTYSIDDVGDDPSFEIDPIGTEVELQIDAERVNAAVAQLVSPYREIVELSFGLIDGEEVKHINISKQLNIPKDQLREYKKEAMVMLREKLKQYTTG